MYQHIFKITISGLYAPTRISVSALQKVMLLYKNKQNI